MDKTADRLRSVNGLTPAQVERLSILMEECGEVVHACGKVLRHGYNNNHPLDQNSNNRIYLEDEVSDLLAAITLLVAGGDIIKHSNYYIADRILKKGKYMHHNRISSSEVLDCGSINVVLEEM